MTERHVLVVGGSSGIGLAIATLAARRGGRVTIAARDPARLADAASRIRDAGGVAEGIVADATSDASVSDLAAAVKGPVDHLCITVSSTGRSARLAEGSLAEAREHFDSRFWATYRVARALLPSMTGPGSSMLFLTGALGRRPMPGRSATAAAHCAVEGLARALAVELAPLRVNTIVAGLVRTPLWNFMDERERIAFFEREKRTIPAGIVGDAEHVADMAFNVLSNPYVTGASLVVDGGATLV